MDSKNKIIYGYNMMSLGSIIDTHITTIFRRANLKEVIYNQLSFCYISITDHIYSLDELSVAAFHIQDLPIVLSKEKFIKKELLKRCRKLKIFLSFELLCLSKINEICKIFENIKRLTEEMRHLQTDKMLKELGLTLRKDIIGDDQLHRKMCLILTIKSDISRRNFVIGNSSIATANERLRTV
jgi:hypothetical protein